MSDTAPMVEGPQPLTAREAALAYIAQRHRQDSGWDYKTDPNYVGPHPTFVGLMSDAEYDRHMAGIAERRQLASNAPLGSGEPVGPRPMPSPGVLRAALPFGQRIRDVRRAAGLTQREVAG